MLDSDEPSNKAAIMNDLKKKLFDLEFKMFKVKMCHFKNLEI
jgi:hypothetical protein